DPRVPRDGRELDVVERALDVGPARDAAGHDTRVLGLDPQVSAYLVELDVAVRVLELETADRSRLHGPVLGVERRPRADVAHVHVAVAGGRGAARPAARHP